MGLLQTAFQTYEFHAHLAGVTDAVSEPLTPISHMIQNAQLEITLDLQGNFQKAERLYQDKDSGKDTTKTIIPATEKSANRTNSPCPHPLSDQLRYIAPYQEAYHKPYLAQLTHWAESEFTHPKVQAVFAYVKSGTILQDLLRAGLIQQEKDGSVTEKSGKQMIRWRIAGSDGKDACWEDQSLFASFAQYYKKIRSDAPLAFCMISGKMEATTETHPKGIVASAYGAKLISSNDTSSFTFRGRFSSASQAATIGYEASQKAHNALRWVAANQGINIGKRTFVCWNPKGNRVPHVIKGPFRWKNEATPPVTSTKYKTQLQDALKGWQTILPAAEDVIIAAFDAATTGRLSATYYRELKASDFLNRLAFWQSHCYWENESFGYQSPSIHQIASCAFGTERKALIDLDSRILREQVQRLMHCVIDQVAIPVDIVQALAQRASLPLSYSEMKNRKKVLFTACAVIYAYRTTAKKEEWEMALEKEKRTAAINLADFWQ